MKVTLAKNLKNLMEAAGLGENALAKQIGIKQPLIHRLLSGENTNPTLNTLQILANYFSISISQLVGEHLLAESVNNEISSRFSDWYPVPLLKAPHFKKQEKYILVDHPLSEKAFALKYIHTNMEPAIPAHAIIVVDPLIPPTHKDFVFLNEEFIIKYHIKKGNIKFLLSCLNNFDTLNPFSAEDNILGTVVRVIYGRKAL